MYEKSLLQKLEYKYGRFAIQNFMTVIVAVIGLVYVLDSMFIARIGTPLSYYFSFDRSAILAGQVWRIITFVLIPYDSSVIFLIFSLYFYWLIGSMLESHWGPFKLNLFYLCGMFLTAAAGMIVGTCTGFYLNMSLFLAFALLYPEFELLVFFAIPVKVKYLAIADLIILAYYLVIGNTSSRVSLIVSLLNVALFFFPNIKANLRRFKQNADMKRRFKR